MQNKLLSGLAALCLAGSCSKQPGSDVSTVNTREVSASSQPISYCICEPDFSKAAGYDAVLFYDASDNVTSIIVGRLIRRDVNPCETGVYGEVVKSFSDCDPLILLQDAGSDGVIDFHEARLYSGHPLEDFNRNPQKVQRLVDAMRASGQD